MQKSIGKYQLIERIGEGGMGEVWRGEDTVLARPVAVKCLHSQYAHDALLRERFLSEARIMARLNHPRIVTLYDFLMEQDDLWLVMELVEGRSLDRLIGKEVGPIPWERAKGLFMQMLSAFEYAHQKGIVHRDIKPSNILVTTEDHIKVTDLGIAKIIGRKGMTRTGTKLGTVSYMSPEQVRGEEATVQSDIYALGITLYEMVSGRTPFDDTSSEFLLMQEIVSGDIPDPREFYPYIPEEVVQAIQRATVGIPAQRFESCLELLSALDANPAGDFPVKDAPRAVYPSTASGPSYQARPPTRVGGHGAAHNDPAIAEELFESGFAHHENGELDEAVKEYREALLHNPRMVIVHYNLGVVLYELGNIAEAAQAFEDALRLDAKHMDSMHNLGVIYTRMGKTAQAIQFLRYVVEDNPRDADAHISLGDALMEDRQFHAAEQCYRQVFWIRPNDPEAKERLERLRQSG